MEISFTPSKKIKALFFFLSFALIGSLAYAEYSYWRLDQENNRLNKEIVDLQTNLEQVKNQNSALSQALQAEQGKNTDLSSVLQSEQSKNQIFETQIGDLSKTVGTLQKLTTTDPELLKKYSKVYFLSENYSPANLSRINSQYLYDANKPQLIHAGVAPFLDVMLASAARDGIVLKIVSAYRSFAEQIAVKSTYQFTYGSGANQFSADQGYSEHQLGTTVDITTQGISGLLPTFENTAAYSWLLNNAYKFGFIISYPKENTYYHFEPWHWRFVGISLATKLHGSGQFFYNLTQREIDTYLVSIFD